MTALTTYTNPAPVLDTVPVDWSTLAGSLVVVTTRPVEALGLDRGDALEVTPCRMDGGCTVTVDTDSLEGGSHVRADALGLPADSDEALIYGIVEDPEAALDAARMRWQESRSAWLEEQRAHVAKVDEVDRLRERVTHYRDDVERIGSALKDAAEAENLCSQYDDAVEEVVSTLMVAADVFRESARVRRDYVVTVPVVVEVPVAVTAEGEDEAREEASSSWRDWITGDENVSTGSPDLDDVDEWPTEEVPR